MKTLTKYLYEARGFKPATVSKTIKKGDTVNIGNTSLKIGQAIIIKDPIKGNGEVNAILVMSTGNKFKASVNGEMTETLPASYFIDTLENREKKLVGWVKDLHKLKDDETDAIFDPIEDKLEDAVYMLKSLRSTSYELEDMPGMLIAAELGLDIANKQQIKDVNKSELAKVQNMYNYEDYTWEQVIDALEEANEIMSDFIKNCEEYNELVVKLDKEFDNIEKKYNAKKSSNNHYGYNVSRYNKLKDVFDELPGDVGAEVGGTSY